MTVVEETLNACFASGATNLPMPSWAPQANETLLLAVITNQPTLAVYGVSGNGLFWTQIAGVENVRGVANGIALFRASSPTTPASGVVMFTADGNKPVKAILTRISGVDITTNDGVEAFGIAPGEVLDSADLKVDITPVLGGASVFAFAGNSRASSSIVSLPVGQSVVFQDSVDCGSGWYRLRAQFWKKDDPVNPAETVTLGKDASLDLSAPWAAIAVALSSAGVQPILEDALCLAIHPEAGMWISSDHEAMCLDLINGTDTKYFLIRDDGINSQLFPITHQAPSAFTANLNRCIADGKILVELLTKP